MSAGTSEGEELLRRNEQVKVAGGDGRRRIGVRSIELKSEIVILIAYLDCELAALVIHQQLDVFRTPRTSETPLEKRTDSSMTVMVNLPPFFRQLL